MSSNHICPEDALKGFVEMKATTFIPMHYGTFDLSDEPMGEPLKRLEQEYHRLGKPKDLRVPKAGESIYL